MMKKIILILAIISSAQAINTPALGKDSHKCENARLYRAHRLTSNGEPYAIDKVRAYNARHGL